jgi:hypothetical protein
MTPARIRPARGVMGLAFGLLLVAATWQLAEENRMAAT